MSADMTVTSQLAWLGGLAGGVVVVAAIVNFLARENRSKLRRVVLLFGGCAVTTAASIALHNIDTAWSHHIAVVAEVLGVLTIVNAAGMLLFLVALPAVTVKLPMIAGDLVVGVGYIVAALLVLSRNGMNPASVVATGAVVSAVLAISLQATLGNILGGVALQLDGSIHEGDLIRLADNTSGRIKAIRWRHTIIDTGGTTVVVPNAQLLANNITILGWHHQPPLPQSVRVTFGVAYNVSPARVTKIVTDAICSSPIDNIATTPRPTCVCTDLLTDGLATYALVYTVIDPGSTRALETASWVRARIYTALRRYRISLAAPGQFTTVEMHDRVAVEGDHADRLSRSLAALRSVHLFQALSQDELATLAEGTNYAPFAAGETIMHQGSVAHSLFVLAVGSAEVRARFDPDAAGPRPEKTGVVATLHAPDFFGEMGLLTGEPRGADVVAKTDVECYRLPQDVFERVLLARPEIATELSERLAARKVGLVAAVQQLDAAARADVHASERERITAGIREFFGL